MQVQPYLFFDGRCEEAIDFYRKTLGAEVSGLMRFKDSPEPCEPGMVPPGAEDKVMHASFRIGDTTVMASDGRCQGQPSFQGFSLALTVFEAHNTVEFALEPKGDATNVTWAMQGDTPYFAKIIHVFINMDSMVGKDFETGLANLKAAAET